MFPAFAISISPILHGGQIFLLDRLVDHMGIPITLLCERIVVFLPAQQLTTATIVTAPYARFQ
jgi:hypothetical protein